MKSLLIYSVIGLALALPNKPLIADFVNGDFETGDLTGWTITPTTNGQTLIQTVVQWDIDFSGPKTSSFVGRFQVGQVTFQSGVPAGIELTQNLNLLVGVPYTISFDWSAHRDTTVSSNAQGGIFELIVNGNVIAFGAAGSTSSTTEKFGTVVGGYVPSFTGLHTVGVRISRPFLPAGDVFQSVDNFAISSPIPEPGTGIAILVTLAGLMSRRRR
ncbi:MAG TPA: PEP-CTERM sorting domain-containing protein [Pirellulaceae bacterium]|nr:PEP-CTERM sorting domain-containing protein [Pirellulaceae bacterium]